MNKDNIIRMARDCHAVPHNVDYKLHFEGFL